MHIMYLAYKRRGHGAGAVQVQILMNTRGLHSDRPLNDRQVHHVVDIRSGKVQ
jgi:hypothetical protein